jgi:hypothetical protein
MKHILSTVHLSQGAWAWRVLYMHRCLLAADAPANAAAYLLPAGLHAFPFHVLSVALHAVVSMMVLALAQHLFAKLEQAAGWVEDGSYAGSSSSGGGGCSAAAAGSVYSSSRSSSSRSLLTQLLMWHEQPQLWLRPVTWAGQVQAVIAAVLFALHPAHTEVWEVPAAMDAAT